jgi:hypothetical protein
MLASTSRLKGRLFEISPNRRQETTNRAVDEGQPLSRRGSGEAAGGPGGRAGRAPGLTGGLNGYGSSQVADPFRWKAPFLAPSRRHKVKFADPSDEHSASWVRIAGRMLGLKEGPASQSWRECS